MNDYLNIQDRIDEGYDVSADIRVLITRTSLHRRISVRGHIEQVKAATSSDKIVSKRRRRGTYIRRGLIYTENNKL